MQINHTPRRFRRASVAALILTAAVFGLASHSALSRSEFQPTDIVTPYPISPGEPLECDVTLTGGPGNVTIYSDPPGAVSFYGPVSGPNATIEASTSSDIDADDVTVYVSTDGSTVVGTSTPVGG